MHIKQLFFCTSFLAIAGCSATIPHEINRLSESESAVINAHTYFSSIGDFKNSNDKLIVYSAKAIPSKNRPQNLYFYLRKHCDYLGGHVEFRGPKLLSNYPKFNVCEIEGQPSFFFYSGTDHLSPLRTVHFVAEKKPNVSQSDFTSYLNIAGYTTPQQKNAEKELETATLEMENSKKAEANRKTNEIVTPLYKQSRISELKRLKQANRGTKICRLRYSHHMGFSGQYRIHVSRSDFGYLEEHSGNRMKILQIPRHNQPQVSSWQDYDNYGLCDSEN